MCLTAYVCDTRWGGSRLLQLTTQALGWAESRSTAHCTLAGRGSAQNDSATLQRRMQRQHRGVPFAVASESRFTDFPIIRTSYLFRLCCFFDICLWPHGIDFVTAKMRYGIVYELAYSYSALVFYYFIIVTISCGKDGEKNDKWYWL